MYQLKVFNITIRGFSDIPADGYTNGTAIVGQGDQMQSLPGDLAFQASCEANLIQKIQDSFGQMRGLAWLYWTLLIGHIALLLVAVTNMTRLRLRN